MLQLFDGAIQKGIKGVYCNACFSRIYYFYDNERTDVWIDGLVRSFEFLVAFLMKRFLVMQARLPSNVMLTK